MQKYRFAAIVGPTGAGKTEISLLVAEKIQTEIIVLDSRQIYQHLNIGVARPHEDMLKKVKHYLLGEIPLDAEFTVFDFKNLAEKIIVDLNRKNILPLLVGGTGLYLRALTEDLRLCDTKPDKTIRKSLEEEANRFGNEYIYQKLKKIDPDATLKITKNDRKRIIRALEVFYLSGKKFSEFQKKDIEKKYDYVIFGITRNRQSLYEKINQRVDKMVHEGLFSEVENILSLNYPKTLNSLQTIGYKEVIDYLEGKMTVEETINLIKKKSRNYAKRQLTFFKSMKDIIWFNLDYMSEEDVAEEICMIISKKLNYS